MEQGARQRTVTAVAGELGELEEVLARKGSEPGVGLQACFDELQRIAVALGREQQWQQFLGDAVGQPRIGPGRDAGAAVLGVESSKRAIYSSGRSRKECSGQTPPSGGSLAGGEPRRV